MSEALTAGETAASTPSPEAPVVETLLGTDPAPAADKDPAAPAEPDKAAEEPKVEPFTFDKVTLPEGIEVPEEAKGAFTELVNEHKIPAEAAQKVMDLYATHAKAQADAAVKVWQDMNTDWQKQVKADPEIGGAKLEGTLQSIAKLVNDPALTDPGFKEAMNLTGAGNNPAIIKSLAKWAAALTEGGHVGGKPGGAQRRPQSFGEALYGTQGE